MSDDWRETQPKDAQTKDPTAQAKDPAAQRSDMGGDIYKSRAWPWGAKPHGDRSE